jgi:hypothetical protein
MNQVYAIVLMLALVGFALTAQTAHGEDVIRLQNGTMVPNTLGVGAPDSEGITLLPNDTYGGYVNGAVGSQIGQVLVRDYDNGTNTANSDMSAGARDNESDSNSTGNMTDPSSNSTQNINATEEDVTGNPYRSQSWNAGYEQAFTGQGLHLRTNHTLDFFYGYENGSEFLHFDKAYAAALSGISSNSPRFGDTSLLFEHQYDSGTDAGTRDRHNFTIGENKFTMYSPLPAATHDNYLNYYIGFDNGAWAADKENQNSTTYYHDNCGAGHTNEYCTGFKAGWNYEADELGPPPSASSSNIVTTASKV